MSLKDEKYAEYEKGTEEFEKLTIEQRDRLISPSVWNKRMSPVKLCPAHVELMKTGSEKFLKQGFRFEEVRYGEGEREVYDVIRADEVTDDTPVLVCFHGGYWKAMGRFQMHAPSEAIVRQGAVCVCVGYDLCPGVSMSRIMEEAVRALEHLFSDLCKNSRRVFLWAHCAGVVNALWGCCHANLTDAALQAIKGFVLWSSVFDMRPVSATSENKDIRMTREEVQRFSLVHKTNVQLVCTRLRHCRFQLCIGEYESPEFYRQHHFYKEVLEGRGLQVEEKVFQGMDHLEPIEQLCLSDSHVTLVNLSQKLIEFIGM